MLLKTQIVSENGWLEDDPFLKKRPFLRGNVSFREDRLAGRLICLSLTCHCFEFVSLLYVMLLILPSLWD